MAGFQVDVVTGIRNITGLPLEAVLPNNHDFVNFGAEPETGCETGREVRSSSR